MIGYSRSRAAGREAFLASQHQRQIWLGKVESQITEAAPQVSGKIKWDTLVFYYNQGPDIGTAVARYLAALERGDV